MFFWDEKANGSVLALLRTLVRVPQKWLRAKLGLTSKDGLTRYERGTTVLPFETLEEAARLMGVPSLVINEAYGLVETWHSASSLGSRPGPSAGPLSEAAAAEEIVATFQAGLGNLIRKTLIQAKLELYPRFERDLAPQLWQVLALWAPELQLSMVRTVPLFQQWALAELICERSVLAAGDQADKALHLAELACEIASRVLGTKEFRLRIQGYCEFHRANAWRVRGELEQARRDDEQAAKLWKAGRVGDSGLLDEARVINIQATLLRDRRELAKALRLFDEGLQLPETREKPLLLLGKARALEGKGDYDAALALILEARRLSPTTEGRLYFATLTNQALLYCHLGRFAEAQALLPEIRRRVRELGNELDRLNVAWLEGRVACGLGHTDVALSHLESARQGFAEQKIRYDQALVTLEIAEVLSSAGQVAKVRQLARSLVPVFRDEGLHPEAARALRLFTEAAEQEALTAELARGLTHYLYRARHDSDLRFQAA